MLKRQKLGIPLAAVFLVVLAAPARGDDVQYLPKGCVAIFSVDVAAFLKSRTY
jgi:hypothetical protein